MVWAPWEGLGRLVWQPEYGAVFTFHSWLVPG